ncbi:DUF6125 family protein [Chloroflexota bacterium]
MDDYSGQFRPNLSYRDLSHELLAKLLALYSRLYIGLDGFWYLAVGERISNEEALACDIKAWEGICKYEMAKITRKLNIQGGDVVSFMKAMQLTPFFLSMQHQIDIKDQNHAVLTITHCPTLAALEKEGLGREAEICRLFDPKAFQNYASFFSPDIEVKCLEAPPRKDRGGICCRWEFGLAGPGASPVAISREAMPGKLDDYSGSFRPALQPADFSYHTLAGLLKLYSRLYIAMDGFWYLAIQERISNEEALSCDIRAWERASKYEMRKITQAMNIQGDDLTAVMKAMQLRPWFINMKYRVETCGEDSVVLAVDYCPTLNVLEKEGEGRERDISRVCAKNFQDYASFFNPDIVVEVIKLPPRESRDEICCARRFRLQSKGS